MRLFVFVLIYLFASPAAAIFDVSPADQSVKYLAQLFGGQIGNVSLGAGAAPALNAMFEKFNLIVSTVGVIVLGYICILSTINTAQEGTAMGKKWSAVWTPFRSVTGMILLVPSPASGYSMIQSFVMWVILQGIGAANAIWGIVLDQYRLGNSAIAVSRVTVSSDSIGKKFPSSSGAINSAGALFYGASYSDKGTSAQNLWGALTCVYTANALGNGTLAFNESTTPSNITEQLQQYGSSAQVYYNLEEIDGGSSSSSAKVRLRFGVPNSNGLEDVCGSMEVKVSVPPSEISGGSTAPSEQLKAKQIELLEVKLAAIKNGIAAAQPIFSGIINGTMANRNMNNYNATYWPNGTLQDIAQSSQGYIYAARAAYLTSLTSSTKETGQSNDGSLVELGKSVGWSTAGQFYFFLGGMGSGNSNPVFTSLVDISQSANNPNSPPANVNVNKFFGDSASNYNARDMYNKVNDQVNIYVSKDKYKFDNNSNFSAQSGGGNLGPASGAMGSLAGTVQRGWADLITGDGKTPLISIAKFGQELLLAAEIIWIVLALGTIIAATIMSICACSNPGFGAAMSMISTIISPILSIMAVMWMIGATLGVWIPMVPYVMFSTALLGWFILVIEAIVSAPILALGLISPSQDELGAAKSGLMILAGLFLRPTLMIFGFILGGRLFDVFVGYLNYGLGDTLNSIWQIAPALFASLLLPLFVYMGLVLASLNKCFALIHILPDKVMRWVGGASEQTDMGMVDQAKSSFDKGAGETNKAMGAISAKAGEMAKGAGEDTAKRAAASEDGGGAGGGGDGGDGGGSDGGGDGGSGGDGGGKGGGKGGGGGKQGSDAAKAATSAVTGEDSGKGTTGTDSKPENKDEGAKGTGTESGKSTGSGSDVAVTETTEL